LNDLFDSDGVTKPPPGRLDDVLDFVRSFAFGMPHFGGVEIFQFGPRTKTALSKRSAGAQISADTPRSIGDWPA
jgi:hypothetical protein